MQKPGPIFVNSSLANKREAVPYVSQRKSSSLRNLFRYFPIFFDLTVPLTLWCLPCWTRCRLQETGLCVSVAEWERSQYVPWLPSKQAKLETPFAPSNLLLTSVALAPACYIRPVCVWTWSIATGLRVENFLKTVKHVRFLPSKVHNFVNVAFYLPPPCESPCFSGISCIYITNGYRRVPLTVKMS